MADHFMFTKLAVKREVKHVQNKSRECRPSDPTIVIIVVIGIASVTIGVVCVVTILISVIRLGKAKSNRETHKAE
jgi:hypothetical protein